MRKTVLSTFSICVFSILLLQKQKDHTSLTIHGKLQNIRGAGEYIYFIYRGYNTTDSTLIINNEYTYTLKTKEFPCEVTIFLHPPRHSSSYIPPNMTVLLLDGKEVTISSVDSFSNVSVSGSSAYLEYSILERMRNEYTTQMHKLFDEIKTFEEKHDWDGVNRAKEDLNQIKQEIAEHYLAYVRSNPSSPVVAYALSKYVSSAEDREKHFEEAKKLYDSMPLEKQQSYWGRGVKIRLFENSLNVGASAPDFSLPDTAGQQISLTNFKGKYVLVDFWASWCGPCREENRYLVKAFEQYGNRQFTILSITIDKPEDQDKWLSAIKKDKLTWTQVIDVKGKVSKQFNIQTIPKNFLIDPEGKIVAKNIRGIKVENTLKQILN